MSGDGKRSVGHRPQATALILDSTEAAQTEVRSDVGFRGVTGLVVLTLSSSAFDVVDGAHSAASKCHRVVRSKRNHIEGNRPWARLARSVWISPRTCFRFTVLMQKARWSFANVLAEREFLSSLPIFRLAALGWKRAQRRISGHAS